MKPFKPTTPPALLPEVRDISFAQPLTWLKKGWADMQHTPSLSLFHGFVVAVMGYIIAVIAHDKFWLLASAVSGFLVVAPLLATSLYAMSCAIEKSRPVNFGLLTRIWTKWQLQLQHQPDSYWSLIRFGLLLAAAATGWVLTSSALITLFSPAPIRVPMDFIRYVVLDREHYVFEIWLCLGGMMAAPVFASSVVTMPLLLDRRIGVLQAVLTSWKAVLRNPATMATWSCLIMGLWTIGVLSIFIGLIFILPLLGHASWHAYRDLVDVEGWPDRMQGQDQP
ncbi:MAG: hypothetical protein RL364_438 [Pseudomonadota bacterium]|jgi:uncharacterized membrane protein